MLLNSRLPCMPGWLYFQNNFLQFHTIWHEIEHPIRKTFYRRVSCCFPRNALWIFHHVCSWCNDVSVLCCALHAAGLLSKTCWSWQRQLPIILWHKLKGSPLPTPADCSGRLWHSHTAADGFGHDSSTCCDGFRALNATACVSRSLRYFIQGRMNVVEQVGVEYRVGWASNMWACPHTLGTKAPQPLLSDA